MTATNAVQITFTDGHVKTFHTDTIRYSLTPLAANAPYAHDERGLIVERARVAEVRLVKNVPAAPLTLSLPKPLDHLRKQPRRTSGKPGRFNSPERRRDTLNRLVARVNASAVTAASYLRSLGADDDTIRKYVSQLGKRAKAIAVAKGITPTLSGLALVGRHLVRCLAYDSADTEILHAAVAEYPKTSHLIQIGA